MTEIKEKVVLVTGGHGFLGYHLVDKLVHMNNGPHLVVAPSHTDLDLTDASSVYHFFDDVQPDLVFHLAGYNGGLRFNQAQPARIFYENTLMALNVLEACRQQEVQKVLSVVASCAYPSELGIWATGDYRRGEMPELYFEDGPPDESVEGHGYAKRNLQVASRLYNRQYGLHAVCACPTTVYGPGDSFDLERTKIMGAMVKRFVDAVEQSSAIVSCWGSGKPLREYLYVDDCVDLLIAAMQQYDDSCCPLNLGTGQELSIKATAELVAKLAGYTGTIEWGHESQDGQFRKRLVCDMMTEYLGKANLTPLEVGIARTINHYYENCCKGA